MKLKKIARLYKTITPFLPPMTYVDAGARAIKSNRFIQAFPDAKYIGFEVDVDECNRLNSLNIERHQFHPQALGRRDDTRTLYVTRNPSCSSLYEPNVQEMHRFMECGPYFDVLEKTTVETVSLDDWCRDVNISGAEFLELDTQGSELDILQGGKHLLASSVLGLKVEVEFFPMYKNQPLFADVDNYLQPFGFRLFDLSRYRLRRSYLKTRGQLLWGHAFYLKSVHQMDDWKPQHFLALAAIASFYGFEDYSLEVLTSLVKRESDFESYEYIKTIIASYSDFFSRPIRKSVQLWWKKASTWRLASRKDGGYFIKD